ncbi:hypothetical protein BSLG_002169 [Batrachochytrium salamandrivorans]|nr:hypothetical protein BSLG_002169 [Batrachochytrium salamandrivorans]
MAWLLAGHLHRTARTTKSHSLSPSTNTIGHEASKGPLVTDASSLPVLVMSISGFVPRSDIGLALVNDALLAQVNGLHIIGRSDTWVDPSRSEQLAMMLQSLCPSQPKTVSDLHPVLNSQTAAPLTLQNRELISCEDPSGSAAKSLDYAESNSQCIFFHDGGHFVPTDAVMRQKIRQYLTERFSQK